MKTLNLQRMKILKIMAISILMITIGICFFTAPEATTGITMAMGLIIGGVQLNDEEEKFLGVIKGEIQSELLKWAEKGVSIEKMQNLLDEKLAGLKEKYTTPDQLAALQKAVEDLSLDVKASKETDKPVKILTLRDQMYNQVKGKSAEELMKGVTLEIRIERKEVGAIAYPTNDYVPFPTMDTSGWGKAPTNPPLFRAISDTSTIATARATWVEMGAREGTAGTSNPAAKKNKIDFTPTVAHVEASKWTALVKFPQEAMEDIYDFLRETEMEIINQVTEKEDAGFFTYYGTKALAYELTTLTTSTPSSYEAILAACAQIRSKNFEPTHILLNPVDFAGLEFAAFQNGYAVAGFINSYGPTIAGVPVIQSTQITAGYVAVGDFKKFHIRDFKNLIVKLGATGDDFEENMITAIGECRSLCYIKGGEEGAFLLDEIQDIVDAITTAS